jgi:hypothetical protein
MQDVDALLRTGSKDDTDERTSACCVEVSEVSPGALAVAAAVLSEKKNVHVAAPAEAMVADNPGSRKSSYSTDPGGPEVAGHGRGAGCTSGAATSIWRATMSAQIL